MNPYHSKWKTTAPLLCQTRNDHEEIPSPRRQPTTHHPHQPAETIGKAFRSRRKGPERFPAPILSVTFYFLGGIHSDSSIHTSRNSHSMAATKKFLTFTVCSVAFFANASVSHSRSVEYVPASSFFVSQF